MELDYGIAETLRQQALEEYPQECCGVLVGVTNRLGSPPSTEVLAAVDALNVHTGDRSRRFAIAPEFLLEIHKTAAREGQEVVGYYHSHPDGSDKPSETDREVAWPDVSYLILGVDADRRVTLRSWRLSDDGTRFREEAVALTGEPLATRV